MIGNRTDSNVLLCSKYVDRSDDQGVIDGKWKVIVTYHVGCSVISTDFIDFLNATWHHLESAIWLKMSFACKDS